VRKWRDGTRIDKTTPFERRPTFHASGELRKNGSSSHDREVRELTLVRKRRAESRGKTRKKKDKEKNSGTRGNYRDEKNLGGVADKIVLRRKIPLAEMEKNVLGK